MRLVSTVVLGLLLLSSCYAAPIEEDVAVSDSTTDTVDSTTPASGEETPSPSPANTPQPPGGSTLEPVATTTTEASTGLTTPKGTVPPNTAPTTTKSSGTTDQPQGTTEDTRILEFVSQCTVDSCTYSMTVPGLNADLFNILSHNITSDSASVNAFSGTEVPLIKKGADTLLATINSEVATLQSSINQTLEHVNSLVKQVTSLASAQQDTAAKIITAEAYIKKIDRNTCYSRKCVNIVITTPKPTTTTTTPKPTVSPCLDYNCGNGTCEPEYSGFGYKPVCHCPGNLDSDLRCVTSVCLQNTDDLLAPGLVVSPGWDLDNGTLLEEDACSGDDTASWLMGVDDSTLVLMLDGKIYNNQTEKPFQSMSDSAVLQIQVGSYKLKITSKTQVKQVNLILGKGNQVTIQYSDSAGSGHFYFTVAAIAKKTTEREMDDETFQNLLQDEN